MPRTFAAVVLLTMLALLSPVKAVAAPLEKASGKMVFDEVEEGLRHYREERDEEKRLAILARLAPSRDLRVAVALGDASEDGPAQVQNTTYDLLFRYFLPDPVEVDFIDQIDASYDWWEKNKTDLRRRAAQLPR